MDKLAGMEMFVRVVECGSFASAADVSDVSATMVAKQIRAIEQRLGARLLHRTTRRQQLTEVGQLYYERCRRVLAEFSLAENSATELQSTAKGLVHMVAPVSFGCQILVPALSVYMAQNPEVNVMLTLDNQTPNLRFTRRISLPGRCTPTGGSLPPLPTTSVSTGRRRIRIS